MEITVRNSLPSESKEIEAIHLKHFAEIGQGPGCIEINMKRDDAIIFSALNNSQEVVGYLIASFYEGTSYLEWIGVKYEKLGTGNALVSNYFEVCKKRNVKSVSLSSRNRFKRALISYVKWGFDIYGVYQGLDGDLMIQLRKRFE